MAYGVEQDRLRAILPEEFVSLRPVLRINAEIRDNSTGYVEFNTAVEKDGIKGWLNIGYWNDVDFERSGSTVTFRTDFLEISFTGVGVEGSCPAEKDNGGCFFIGNEHIVVKKDNGAVNVENKCVKIGESEYRKMRENEYLRKPEIITVNKEFCDCRFAWRFTNDDAHGESVGKTLPAYPTEIKKVYPKKSFTTESAAKIPCEQVLGSYRVVFER